MINRCFNLIHLGLTQTQLWLLLAINSLFFRGWKVFNFVMVYEEYKSYMQAYMRKSGSDFRMKICKEYLALAEFEFLQSRRLIQQVDDSKNQQKYNMVKSLLLPEQIIEAVTTNSRCSTAMKEWATRGLVN